MNALIGKARERELVAKVAARYRGEGYETATSGPDFLDGRPDLVLQRGDERVVVEIKTARSPAPHLERWAKEIAGHPGWRLDVVVVDESESDVLSSLTPQPLASLGRQIDEARELIAAGHVIAGGLLAWSSFEGVGREALRRTAAAEPVDDTPSLVRLLLTNNFVSDEEYRRLDEARGRRNALAHGYAVEPSDAALFEDTLKVARDLMAELMARDGTAR
jgi:hypothetical protein